MALQQSIMNNHIQPALENQASPLSQPVQNSPWTDGMQRGYQEWSAAECVGSFFKHKSLFVSILALCVLATVLISVAQPRYYRSEATIEVQGINDNFLNT